jgi:hypothetical protein
MQERLLESPLDVAAAKWKSRLRKGGVAAMTGADGEALLGGMHNASMVFEEQFRLDELDPQVGPGVAVIAMISQRVLSNKVGARQR